MELWQMKAANDLREFFKSFTNVAKIELDGSLLDFNTVDKYSDVDMHIYLSNNSPVDINGLVNSISARISDVFGYEVNNDNNRDTLRICFMNGWRFDLTFLYPKQKETSPENNYVEDSINKTINQFWFISAMVLVKLGRNDYLIASHLVLELCQLNIVMQMLERDRIKSTNIHRFGSKEDVPILHSLIRIKNNYVPSDDTITKDIILDLLFKAAEQMDKTAVQLLPEYVNRCDTLKELFFFPPS